MKCASITLALLDLGTGLQAARIWWKASKVPNSPEIIPDDPVYGTMAWAESTKEAFRKSGELNARAARLDRRVRISECFGGGKPARFQIRTLPITAPTSFPF